MDFYALLSAENETLQQGDILEEVPFCYFDLSRASAVLADGTSETRDLASDRSGVLGLVSRVVFSWGLVLSQTCDIQPDSDTGWARKPILVARVRPIKEVVPAFKDDTISQAVNAVANVATAARSPTVFYLPQPEASAVSLPKSGADLLDVQRYQPADLPALIRRRRLRLSPAALGALQERCAYCSGRYAAPDDLYYSAAEWAEVQRKAEARRRSQGR